MLMNEYAQMWIDIIENMNNDNTYKLAWGRAILEIVYSIDNIQDYNVIHFKTIARNMVKYYWNQTYFFDLHQSSNHKKPPVIYQKTQMLIQEYQNKTHSHIPEWFDKAEIVLKENQPFYDEVIQSCAKKLKDDVSWRFMNCKGYSYSLYELDKKLLTISFTRIQIETLKEYGYIFSQLLNYRWAQLLEQFNTAPKIALKVKGISASQIKRQSLSKYKNILLDYYHKPIDFYTDKELVPNDISVDHVIPWSFMYSDDIWNLVLTSKSNNSSKSNSVPSVETIKKLKERNKQLLQSIDDYQLKSSLEEAISNNYVDKFYYAMKY